MANSSILGSAKLPDNISAKDLHALGPSDNSDSGSDATGAYGDDALASDSDAAGTGERASAGSDRSQSAADNDLDNDAGDDFDDLGEVEEPADDSDSDGDGDGDDAGTSPPSPR